MHPDLILASKQLYQHNDLALTQFEEELESKEYSASSFLLNACRVKFRQAKITPTKVGLFVVLWKRNAEGVTQAYESTDDVDFVIIGVRKGVLYGQFIFPKTVLIQQGILSQGGKGGKRGFRVYPPWEKELNVQAKKTQLWQVSYFIELSGEVASDITKWKELFAKGS
jgi:hypothetical protein